MLVLGGVLVLAPSTLMNVVRRGDPYWRGLLNFKGPPNFLSDPILTPTFCSKVGTYIHQNDIKSYKNT